MSSPAADSFFYILCLAETWVTCQLCYASFVNILLVMVLLLVFYRCFIGFEQDIWTQTRAVFCRLSGNGSLTKSS